MFAVRGTVTHPAVLLNGTLINRRGQIVASSWLLASFESERPFVRPFATATELLDDAGVLTSGTNPGPVALPDADLIRPAVDAATTMLSLQMTAAARAARARVERWQERAERWQHEADALIQRQSLKQGRSRVRQLSELSADMLPDRQLVRPLLVVLPADTEVSHG